MKVIDTEAPAEPINNRFRLPRTVWPESYDIKISPNLEKGTFSGKEVISINVLQPLDKVVLHARDLDIQEAYVSNISGTRFNCRVALDAQTQMATFSVDGVLGFGNWSLTISFSGTFSKDLRGFYGSSWKDAQGAEHLIATTQFEAADARRAFPCFDEPEFKATFKVCLVVDEKLTVLSNTRIAQSLQMDNGKKQVQFQETMKMSTYLVAFIVGEFVSSQPASANGKELRIWTVPGKEQLTSLALKAAKQGVEWYEGYFRIPYAGGDKIDFVAIPDFEVGAMENLGCITFRDTALLVDENTAPHASKKRVAEVVLHELAHQWFGDLVTMRWWDSLWLNESFATFMENKSLAQWQPSWNIWDEFGLSRAMALRLDALKSTHPIESPVNLPEEAQELFDAISYEKGCSVLYMLEQFIGEEVFRDGISSYLKVHAYCNTRTSDLWDSLQEACQKAGLNIPVRQIMDRWVLTAGHPVVYVEEGRPGFIRRRQQEFKFLMSEADPNKSFPIPLTMRALSTEEGLKEGRHLLEGTQSADVYVGEDLKWVVLNADGSGVYRVIYSNPLLLKLVNNLPALSVIERFNLVNDLWSGVRAGLVTATEYLEVIKHFAGESDPNVWAIILGSLSSLYRLLPKDPRSIFQQQIQTLLRPAFDRLGWTPAKDEPVQTRELRASLINTLGTIGGDKEIQEKADTLFAGWLVNRQSVDSNIVPSLVYILAFTGGAARYEQFVQLSGEAKNPQDENLFRRARASFNDPELLQRTIEATLDGQIRTQDAPYLLAACVAAPVAFRAAWDFMRANWDKIVATFPQMGVVNLVRSLQALDQPGFKEEIQAFFEQHPVAAGTKAVAQTLEQLSINLMLRQRETDRLVQYLTPPPVPSAPAAPAGNAKP